MNTTTKETHQRNTYITFYTANAGKGKKVVTMKRTKSMIYNETAESRELELYADNNSTLYHQFSLFAENLNKKVKKGIYNSDKAVDLFYHLATAASEAYNRDFGYKFSVADRFTVAVNMRNDYESNYMTA